MHEPSPSSLRARVPWSLLLWAAAFAAAHTQAPLYYSNQNQYFVHGLADAGRGFLADDWLAQTRDPTPLFSALVAFADRNLGDWAIYALFFVLMGVYFISLASLMTLFAKPASALARSICYCILVLTHAAIVRWGAVQLAGNDYPWFLQCGVANQYVLGPGLQPSAFGVFLVASLATFAHGRLLLAALCCAATIVMHSTYLLPAALLTIGYLIVLCRDKQWRRAALLGSGILLAALPVVTYNLVTFAPTSPKVFGYAQELLAEFRIPHHAVVSRWLDWIAWLQIAWIGLGIFLARRTRLIPVIAFAASAGLFLSVLQVVTGNHTLALLFPWRISAVLVPVATAIVAARIALKLARWTSCCSTLVQHGARAACIAFAVASVVGGVIVLTEDLGYAVNKQELPVLDHLRGHARKGNTYLIPVSLPKPKPGQKGVASATFLPAPRAGSAGSLIAVDLQRIRVYAHVPIYVDFKAIPYMDVEVLRWRERLGRAEAWFALKEWDAKVIAEMLGEGITHVVIPVDRKLKSELLKEDYADDVYRVCRIAPIVKRERTAP